MADDLRSPPRFSAVSPSALAAARVRVVPKADSRLMRVFGMLLRAVGNRAFVERYWTTLGRVIYYPTSVADPFAYPVVLEHELVHVAQWERFGLWMWLSYLLLPFPCVFAWFRFRWEREAYLVELAHAADRERELSRIVDALWFGYGFPWPRPWMRRWFERAVAARAQETAPNELPKINQRPSGA